MRYERATVLVLVLSVWCFPAAAFRIVDAGPILGLGPTYARWDAASRTVGGVERSLAGGLRYSLEGGSFEAFRDRIRWAGAAPTVVEFEDAVRTAFDAWTVTDPVTGLGSSLSFVADLATPVVDQPGDLNDPFSFLGPNAGSEIDLLVATPHFAPELLASVEFFLDPDSIAGGITLTSGTEGYQSLAIAGADIRFNPDVTFSLDEFQATLTHEIGHTLGLADAEVFPGPLGVFSPFLDDDFDGTSAATATRTLTNSFALQIDPLDPDSTPLLQIFSSLNGSPGLDSAFVDILMESEEIFLFAGIDAPLRNDDFAGRQFLYPAALPEPSRAVLVASGILLLALRRRAT